MNTYELNIDGLVGPTHNYAGLALGNLASTSNALNFANPLAAALQGLEKMRFLHQLGFKQALLPPHQRPNLHLLYDLGFTGSMAQQLSKARKEAPAIFSASFSAASMWTANAATVSPSTDTFDSRLHFTAANLISNLHRQQEAPFTSSLLKTIFADETYFCHHPVLPRTMMTSDEGAANHNRLAAHHGASGIHFYVYGKNGLNTPSQQLPIRFPARQTLEASEAIARSHGLNRDKLFFVQQNPEVIDKGVFHHDVIGVANESVLLLHEKALVHQKEILHKLKECADFQLKIIEVPEEKVSVANAVASYLFNSQLLTQPNGKMILLAPKECEENLSVRNYLQELVISAENPIENCHFFDLKQSMRNGGGPACLRLRVVINELEFNKMHQGIILNNPLFTQLETWIKRHYRDRLHLDDLVDTAFVEETMRALDELTDILGLGSIYPFQQEAL